LSGSAGSGWAGLGAVLDVVRLTRPSVASGNERRVKTFWEVAADAGLRTAVVNWWATWPAPSTSGTVISDRATLRLERGGPLDAEIAPAALYDDLSARWPALRAEAEALVLDLLRAGGPGPDDALLMRSAHLDAVTRVLTAAVSGPDTDLTVSYYPGLDIVQHSLAGTRAADVERYYVMLDRLLAPVLEPADGEIVVVLTAPGRVEAGEQGRFALRGNVGADAAAGAIDGRDVAPTLLYALGLPVSRALPGTAATGLLSRSFDDRYPIRFVA
jgi:hypothetical protein